MKTITFLITLVAMVGVALCTASAQGNLTLVYESMNYTAGDGVLHGKTGDDGFSGPWVLNPTASGKIAEPGMTYTDGAGNSTAQKGNRFETRAGYNDVGFAPLDVNLWSAANKDGGKLNRKGAEIWFSVLMKTVNNQYNHFHLYFSDAQPGWNNGPGYFAVGRAGGSNAKWEIRGDNDDGDSDQLATSTESATVDTFIVGRLKTDGTSGDTTMDVWFDPLLDTAPGGPGTGDLSITVPANDDGSATQINRLGYLHQKWESPNLLDEIRMGESYDAVTPLDSSECDMLTLEWDGHIGDIDGTNVAFDVPFGTDVTTLAPTFTVSARATANPVSGTVRDFSTPQTYTITAEDGITTKDYVVTVSVLSAMPTLSGAHIVSSGPTSAVAEVTLSVMDATAMWLYWGDTDEGESFTWDHTHALGARLVADSPISGDLTNLVADSTYYYIFYATNSGDEASDWSESHQVFDTAIAVAPTITQAAPGATDLSLQWTGTFNTEDAFYVRYTTAATNVTTWLAGPNTTSATVSGLDSGTTYTFFVAASNAAGLGPWSTGANVTTIMQATIEDAGSHLDIGEFIRTSDRDGDPDANEIKELDADGDNIYGTDGYVFYGVLEDETDFSYKHNLQANTRRSLPSYLTSVGDSFSTVQAPVNSTVIDSPDLSGPHDVENDRSAVGLKYGFGSEADLVTLTIGSGFPADGVRVGIFTDNQNYGDKSPMEYYKITQTTGGGTPSPSLQITAVGDDAPGDQLGNDFYFFDIKNAVEGDEFTVYGLCPSNNGPYIGGLTFDSIGSIVQPSRGMLIIVR